MDRLQIEKIGGPGFGGPHLKSRGEVVLSDLSDADRQFVERLFDDPRYQGDTAVRAPRSESHPFFYSITRQTPSGPKTVVAPENAVPASLKDSVRDVLE